MAAPGVVGAVAAVPEEVLEVAVAVPEEVVAVLEEVLVAVLEEVLVEVLEEVLEYKLRSKSRSR